MTTENSILQPAQAKGGTTNISREKLVSLAKHLYGGNAANLTPVEPVKPGPFDSIIRKVSGKVFRPQPDPWHTVAVPSTQPWHSDFNTDNLFQIIAQRHPDIYEVINGGRHNWTALNPQPLPPKAAFIAAFTEEVMDRILLMQEVADAMNKTGEEQAIIIVSGKLDNLVEELFGPHFKAKIKIPFPYPHQEDDGRLSGLELIVAGAVCESIAATVVNKGLQQEIMKAGEKLIETGFGRI